MSSIASGAEPFEVTREVLLESGRFPTPKALIQTKDGGYVVAGMEANKPWDTRTDAEGNLQWRYVVPLKDEDQGGGVRIRSRRVDDG